MKSMMVLSGSSNKPLAWKLARKLKVRLGKVEYSRFANGEARVRVVDKLVSSRVVIVQSLSKPPDEYLVEFCLICDALQRMGVTSITGVIPWLGYSKQDKVFREGEPLSVKIIAKILQVVLLEKIITFDLHNPAILGFFDVPVVNLSAKPLFTEHFNKLNRDDLLVAAPDAGAVKSASEFADRLGVKVVYLDKERNLNTGKVVVRGISRKVKGKDILILDDMIATGSTLMETAKYLKGKGAGKVRVAVTHHLYLGDTARKLEKSLIDEIVVTDTIKKPENLTLRKTRILSCAGLIADEFK